MDPQQFDERSDENNADHDSILFESICLDSAWNFFEYGCSPISIVIPKISVILALSKLHKISSQTVNMNTEL